MFKPNIIKYLLPATLAIGLLSCNNESVSQMQKEEEQGSPVKVEFNIPSITFGDIYNSRAGEKVSGYNQEGWISNLYLVVIKDIEASGDGTEPDEAFNVYELDTTGYNPQVGENKEPSNFYVNLYPGTYKFYILANFDRYLDRFTHVSNIKNEYELKSLYLQFNSSMPLVPAHLPMASGPENFSCDEFKFNDQHQITIPEKETETDSEGNEVIKDRTITINAKMHFICSKVRYTILFDNTVGGFSEKFGNNSIRFIVNQTTDRPIALNIRDRVGVEPTAPLTKYDYIDGSWTLELNRYQFPEAGDKYPTSSSDQLVPWEDQPNLAKWKAATQRAWQGITYLPENNDPNKFTLLTFPYVLEKYKGEDGNYEEADLSSYGELPKKEFSLFGNESDVHYGPDYSDNEPQEGYSKGLRRNYFYDVVAIVKNIESDRLEIYTQVFVGDQPWVYHDNKGQIW